MKHQGVLQQGCKDGSCGPPGMGYARRNVERKDLVDDTGVNGIELLCDRPKGPAGFLGESIRSDEGTHGTWPGGRLCRTGTYITGLMVVSNVSFLL